MDGQSNLHSEVVLVPVSVHVDHQREEQYKRACLFREPGLCPVLACSSSWYFSEILVGLSFFDDRIGAENTDGGKPPNFGT